ncbi:MAG: hypothetical protein VX100_17575 [Pseudomonadota bacterium]|jgi:hypothetical protein|uniref:hypothetical protein n=1 Tax=Pseudoalteromonas spongiae TaxID=298657 RepID=UPI000C2D07AA|nr:hypothetical protein [Pseudoalteromonas spongiae]MEC8327877.1 hypothetical protein [Pseudomonadota bacterium]TMO87450.1 hypothetical protein CWC15_03220 [Pseudoalteromonas spongiae]
MKMNVSQYNNFLVNWYLNEERKRKERIERFRELTKKVSDEDEFDENSDDEYIEQQDHQEKESNEGI